MTYKPRNKYILIRDVKWLITRCPPCRVLFEVRTFIPKCRHRCYVKIIFASSLRKLPTSRRILQWTKSCRSELAAKNLLKKWPSIWVVEPSLPIRTARNSLKLLTTGPIYLRRHQAIKKKRSSDFRCCTLFFVIWSIWCPSYHFIKID